MLKDYIESIRDNKVNGYIEDMKVNKVNGYIEDMKDMKANISQEITKARVYVRRIIHSVCYLLLFV